MKRPIQPYESHMQYVPQWMCDYNLYGCAYLDAKHFLFRSPVPEYQDVMGTPHVWHDRSINASIVSDPANLPRQSHCSLEVDISVEDITNRLDIKERRIHHDFTEQDQPFSNERKLVYSMAGLWRDETRRRKARMGLKDSDASPFPPDVLVSVSADPRNTSPGGWIHEDEYREKLHAEIANEKGNENHPDVSYQDFIANTAHQAGMKTAFESITSLFSSSLVQSGFKFAEESLLGDANELPVQNAGGDVDETRILELQNENLLDSDDETENVISKHPKDGLNSFNASDILAQGLRAPGMANDPALEAAGPADDIKPTDESKLAHSSSELEGLGVRNVESLGQINDDSFTIESEYRSNITAAVARAHSAHRVMEASSGIRKRRKLYHFSGESPNGNLTASTPGQKQLLNGQDSSPEIDGVYHGREHDNVSQENEARDGFDSNRTDSPVHSRNSKTGNTQRLPFAVVKHPQDPNPIRRLSQQSQPGNGSPEPSSKRIPHQPWLSPGGGAVACAEDSWNHRSASATLKTHHPTRRSHQTLSRLSKAFDVQNNKTLFVYTRQAPPRRGLMRAFKQRKLPTIKYRDAHFGDENDVPELEREYAGKGFKLESVTVPYLPDFTSKATYTLQSKGGNRVSNRLPATDNYAYDQRTCSIRNWEIKETPPSREDVVKWMRSDLPHMALGGAPAAGKPNPRSQIDAATQKNKHGFKYSQKQADTSVRHETQYMSLMSLEVHVNTRGNLVPDPEMDEVACIFWCVQSDGSEIRSDRLDNGIRAGVLALSEDGILKRKLSLSLDTVIEEEDTELDLINRTVDIVRDYDPDILTGFEVHNSSWGYLIERARRKYDFDLCDEFSRTRSQSHGRIGKTADPWGFNQTSTIRITGRHMINIWRAMRGELNLLQYTLENIVFHILHQRVPHYSFKDLTGWYTSGVPRNITRVVEYYLKRAHLDIEILEQNELIPRTSEQARLLGVDFFSVFSRGSQFKVESLMFRIAKPENFILVSPSRKQVGQQNALECLPLVMEPQSAFYPSPLLVLDFQSLYPSVMIAYNYCYSTFLGRIVHWRGQNKMGFSDFNRQHRLLELLKAHINIAPNGMMYARPEARKSLLAKMLGEILETRIMVKSGMKVDKDDKTLQQLLNNRQLALKLIANVTYGYTSASFSGRMPCSEIADSIVQTGRETLEKAIALIHSVERWGAEVVYGDTDSLFVYLKGRTRSEAFDIGEEIAKAVTSMNPRPVKLKFEKVYHPCVLLAKKRYVGFKFESRTQKKPDFDAKGIETVRRDGTPAEQKIEERALKILFRTADLSSVKAYFQRQCTKIMKGQVSIRDFCFAREVKLGTYSDRGPPPPGALISTRRMLEDPRTEPQYGERVPYVVIAGAPGARLIDRCVAPDVLLQDDQQELDAEYYITKNLIPPLERIFNLVGANVKQWYDEMPKHHKVRRIEIPLADQGKQSALIKKTLESYLKNSACIICRQKLEEAEIPLCSECLDQSETSLLVLRQRLGRDEKRAARLHEICRSCAQIPFGENVQCNSKDCPVFYTRTRHMALLSSNHGVVQPVLEVLESSSRDAYLW